MSPTAAKLIALLANGDVDNVDQARRVTANLSWVNDTLSQRPGPSTRPSTLMPQRMLPHNLLTTKETLLYLTYLLAHGAYRSRVL